MLYRYQSFKSFALLLMLTLCVTTTVVQAQDDYAEYDNLDYEEAMTLYYGNHMEDNPEEHADPEPAPKNESKNASEQSQGTSQRNQEPQEQSQVVSDQSQVLSDQTPEESSAVGPDVDLRQLASQNTNAIKKIAGIMSEVVSKLSSHSCLGSGENGANTNMQLLSNSIKEGFSVLVGAVQDLNATVQHYQAEITRKAFGTQQAATTFENDGPCPAPFFLVGKDCLYIETEHLRDFPTARQACIDMGAKLAEFSNFEPFIEAIRNMDLHRNAEVFIGGTDEASENDWMWLSGGHMTSIIWGPGEPNNIDSAEHCIALTVRWGKFNDLRCSFRREYACQWNPAT